MWANLGQSKTKCHLSPYAWVWHEVQRRRCQGCKTTVLLANATSPFTTVLVFLDTSKVILGNLNMNAVLRHIGQAMYEADDLSPWGLDPQLMCPWPSSSFPENKWRGDTPLEAAKLPEAGHLDISHLLDVSKYDWGARRAANLQFDTI